MNTIEIPEKINSKVIDDTEIDVDFQSKETLLDLDNDLEFDLQVDLPLKEINQKIITQNNEKNSINRILKIRTNSYSNSEEPNLKSNSENPEKINSSRILDKKEKECSFHSIRKPSINFYKETEYNKNNKKNKNIIVPNSYRVPRKSPQRSLSQRWKEKSSLTSGLPNSNYLVPEDTQHNKDVLKENDERLKENDIIEFYKRSSFHNHLNKSKSPKIEYFKQNVKILMKKAKQKAINIMKNNKNNRCFKRKKIIEILFEDKSPKIINKKSKLKTRLISQLEEKLKQNRMQRENNIFSYCEIKKICKDISIMDESEKCKKLFEEMWKIISNNNLCIMKNFMNFLLILFDLKEEINCEMNLNFQKNSSNKRRIGEIRNGILVFRKDEGERIRKYFKLFILNFIFNKQNPKMNNNSDLEDTNCLIKNSISPNLNSNNKSHSNPKQEEKLISYEQDDKFLHKFLRFKQYDQTPLQRDFDTNKPLNEEGDLLKNSTKSPFHNNNKNYKNKNPLLLPEKILQQSSNKISNSFCESSRNSSKKSNNDLNNFNQFGKCQKNLHKKNLNLKENKLNENHKGDELIKLNKITNEAKLNDEKSITKEITNKRPLLEIPEITREDPFSLNSSVKEKGNILLYIDVNIGNESFERIYFKEGDIPENVASEFVMKHELDNLEKEKLIVLIKNNINNLLESIEEESYEE